MDRTFRYAFRESGPSINSITRKFGPTSKTADRVVIRRAMICFTLEPLIEALRRVFDRHVASATFIACAIHFPIPPEPIFEDFVGAGLSPTAVPFGASLSRHRADPQCKETEALPTAFGGV